MSLQSYRSPATDCAQSPDNRLKSSRAEAAETGAEETEEVAPLAAGGADGPEIREQPRRESSAARGSAEGQWKPKRVEFSSILIRRIKH